MIFKSERLFLIFRLHNCGLRVLWGKINISQKKFNWTFSLFCFVFHDLASAMQVLFQSFCSQNKETRYLLQVQNLQKRRQIARSHCSLCHDPSAPQTRCAPHTSLYMCLIVFADLRIFGGKRIWLLEKAGDNVESFPPGGKPSESVSKKRPKGQWPVQVHEDSRRN